MSLVSHTGPALRMLRKRAGLTQQEASSKAQISKNLISNWERGATAPSIPSLGKVLGILEANLLDLHNTIRLLHGEPADQRPAVGSERDLSPAGLPARLAWLLSKTPEVMLWALELLRTFHEVEEGRRG